MVEPGTLLANLRKPATWGDPPTWNPALSAGEQTIYDDLVAMSKFGLTSSITLAEFQAVKSDLATAKAFVGIVSPTAAQSNAALKSTIRVLGALLRA